MTISCLKIRPKNPLDMLDRFYLPLVLGGRRSNLYFSKMDLEGSLIWRNELFIGHNGASAFSGGIVKTVLDKEKPVFFQPTQLGKDY